MPARKKPTDTARTENVSVRLNPKLHYLASIAARQNQRTLSGFIEWAVRQVLEKSATAINEPMPGHPPAREPRLWEERLWDVDEADRFYKLAELRPGLLTIPEQRLWKLFNMHTNYRPTLEAFREFWNDSSINTSHLKEGGE